MKSRADEALASIKKAAPQMDIAEMKGRALTFMSELEARKSALAPSSFAWYPYNTLSNFLHLDALLTGEHRSLLELIGDKSVVDVGCADGDTAFFLETLGCTVQTIDYAPTNYNSLQGVRLLKNALSSSVEIHEIDLDAQFLLPQEEYGLVFFLGILYHLKNPYYALETLAKSCEYCLISTRIAKFSTHNAEYDTRLTKPIPGKRTDFSHLPIAYLLDEREANNDSTNYWIFSDTGLRRILERTGWDICDFMTVGNTANSDPASAEGDERAFCLVKSRKRDVQQ